jgi:hypothetical protein
MLGHGRRDMTARYTHPQVKAMIEAVSQLEHFVKQATDDILTGASVLQGQSMYFGVRVASH